jgi:precorrin-2 dehydrogenase/sirohydrochlorin ferrochelatase
MNMKYPMNMEMAGRRCLILGGGPVALRKAKDLVRAEAIVDIVAPEIELELQIMVEAGVLSWEKGIYRPSILGGQFLMICATDNPHVNERAAKRAKELGILVNAPAQPWLSDFTVPASFTRGQLTLAVSTDGLSPALAKAIRERLEMDYPPVFGTWLVELSELREELKNELPTPREREKFWRLALDDELLDLVKEGKLDQAEAKIKNASHKFRTQS